MMRTPLFPHAAAWAIVVVLLAIVVTPQWCPALSHVASRPSPQAQTPTAEIVPEDRPDRHDYDERAFVDEMNGHPPKPIMSRTARRLPGLPAQPQP